MNRLYRQLAKQLHPDKETNVDKKEEKKKLMQQLSRAKREKDIFTMLNLAQTWLPDFEISLDKTSLSGFEAPLTGKLKELDMAYHEMKCGSSIESEVWRKFGGGSKVSRDKTISEYCLNLRSEAKSMETTIGEVRTVKHMQSKLRDRMDAHSLVNFVHSDFFFENDFEGEFEYD